ncbi:TPA: hypothetical protein WI014_001277 [Neisseria meningitidis]|jgi:hypothetical protein
MAILKYFVAHDGNPIGLFDSERMAEKAAALDSGCWTEEEFEADWDFAKSQCNKYGGDPLSRSNRDSLYFFDTLELDESGNILKVSGQDFIEFIVESSGYEENTPEFEESKTRYLKYFLGN